MSPVALHSTSSLAVMKRFAYKLHAGEVSGLSIQNLPRNPSSFDDLAQLCGIYSEIELFLWLQKKFEGSKMEEQTALLMKEQTIELIGAALEVVRVVLCGAVVVVSHSPHNSMHLYRRTTWNWIIAM